jgi:hypothetical protein
MQALICQNCPEWSLRQFDSCRESGYDIMTDTLYIMFESYDLFETVMTDEGKKVAETLGLDILMRQRGQYIRTNFTLI